MVSSSAYQNSWYVQSSSTQFFTGGILSYHPTSSVEALKENYQQEILEKFANIFWSCGTFQENSRF